MVQLLKVDPRKAEKYARAQCTDARIAAVCNVSETTLKRRLGPQLQVWRLAGQAELQRAQWDKGIKSKDTTMLRHLGKHYLGQHDQVQLTSTAEPEVRRLLSHWDDGRLTSIKPMITTQADTQIESQKQALVVSGKANCDDEAE